MKILLLKNHVKYQFEDDLTKYKAWLKGLGFEPEIIVKEVNLPLKHSMFIDKSYWLCLACNTHNNFDINVCGKCKKLKSTELIIKDTLWGLDGIKEQIREKAIVPPCTYQLVIFCYDIDESGWKDRLAEDLCFWTYPKDLNGSVFIELCLREWFDPQGDIVFNAARHESIHAMNRLLNFRNIYLPDTIDNGGAEKDNLDRMKPYFGQMLVFSLLYRITKIKELIQYLQAVLLMRRLQNK